jgi:hypothetical protein
MGAFGRTPDKIQYMQTSGPGAIHLLNGLYDVKLDHQPVLAIVGQQARAAIANEFARTCQPSKPRQPSSECARHALAFCFSNPALATLLAGVTRLDDLEEKLAAIELVKRRGELLDVVRPFAIEQSAHPKLFSPYTE